PGFVKDAWITVDKAGTYRGQCSQICGKEHGFMPIVVVAKAPAEYAAWVQERRLRLPRPRRRPTARAPTTPPAWPVTARAPPARRSSATRPPGPRASS